MPTGPVRPVEREQRQAGDDRRQRERQVDQRVDDPLAAGTRRARAPTRSACPSRRRSPRRSSEAIEREPDRRHRLGCGDARPRTRPRPPSSERTTTAASGIRTISVSQATRGPPMTSGPRRLLAGGYGGAAAAPRQLRVSSAVETPRSRSIFATEPFSGSKNSSLTLAQPPNLSISNSVRRRRDTSSRRPGRRGSSGSPSRRRSAAPPACGASRRTPWPAPGSRTRS